eukprot:9416185-Lingulodinium_polyedra.AAC.1
MPEKEAEDAELVEESAAEEDWSCCVVKSTRRDQRCDECGALAEGRKSYWVAQCCGLTRCFQCGAKMRKERGAKPKFRCSKADGDGQSNRGGVDERVDQAEGGGGRQAGRVDQRP